MFCFVHLLEISDLVTAVDPRSGRRLPVRRAEVIQQLLEREDERGSRIVAELPADQDGALDPPGAGTGRAPPGRPAALAEATG
ncbi:hypothetical protein [Streptomyces sp. NPDC005017]|uniref:hypothetical protein n=1 Tax=Streptomyces sp. NPDC005017 TaxID=3364706 RepID=UPI00369479EB